MEPLVNQQLQATNVIPPSTAADDRTVLLLEDLQNLATGGNGGANKSDSQEGEREDDVLTPTALGSLSPDIRQASEKQRTLKGTFANAGDTALDLQQPSNNVNTNFKANYTDPLVQDILKGHQNLGRSLNRDSALAVEGQKSSDMSPAIMMNSTISKNLQSQSHYGDFGGGRDYLDKRSHINSGSGRDRRPSKSPLPTKKNQSNNHSSNANTQKQSLKQLGLSYGILAKQDTHNKLVSSKNKRGSKSKANGVSSDYHQQQQTSPNKKNSKANKGASAIANKAAGGVLDQVYFVNAPMGQEIILEGNQITYDQQTALSPINELTKSV